LAYRSNRELALKNKEYLLIRLLRDIVSFHVGKYRTEYEDICMLLKTPLLDINMLKQNKILSTLAYLCREYIRDPQILKILEFKLKKYYIYLSEVDRLAQLFEKHAIDYVFIKTIKHLPIDIADIDVLIRTDQIPRVENILMTNGYYLRGKYLNAQVWAVIRQGIVIDIDLQWRISYSEVEYFPSDHLLSNYVVFRGIRTAPSIYEYIVLASHDILKDLKFDLADLIELSINLYYMKDYINEILSVAKKFGLKDPTVITTTIISNIFPEWNIENAHVKNKALNYYNVPVRMGKMLFSQIIRNGLPLRIPLLVTLYAHSKLFASKARREGLMRTLKQISSISRASGIKILVRYLLHMQHVEYKDIFE